MKFHYVTDGPEFRRVYAHQYLIEQIEPDRECDAEPKQYAYLFHDASGFLLPHYRQASVRSIATSKPKQAHASTSTA